MVAAVISSEYTRFLFIDFELAQWYPKERSPKIDIWWQIGLTEDELPPGGIRDVDPFAWDVMWTARTLRSAQIGVKVARQYVDVEWPPFFVDMIQQMTLEDPSARPDIQSCRKRFESEMVLPGTIKSKRGKARLTDPWVMHTNGFPTMGGFVDLPRRMKL